MRSLIGGVAATAAVRAWPFRVYSLPSQPVLTQEMLRQARDFLKSQGLGFRAYEYRGLPLLIDPLCPPGKIYDMSSLVTLYKTDVKVCHPQTLNDILLATEFKTAPLYEDISL